MIGLLKSFVPDVDRRLKNLRAVCGLPACRNTQLMRHISGARSGICVGSVWYCCVDCFTVAALASLEKLCSRQVVEIPRYPRMSLGLFLLSKGYLTAKQLRAATVQSQCLDEGIEETLVKLGMVTEKQLAAARSAQWGYPVLAPEHAGQKVEADIPKTILNACMAVPLHYSDAAKRILVGFAARVEHRFLESIEEITRCRVESCFITPTYFEEQMARLATPRDYEEVVVDNPGLPDKMASTVGRIAGQVAASEAIFGLCRNLVLVRLAGKRGKTDIVFRMRCNVAVEIGEHSGIFSDAIAV
jgi:hypothetical protein